jgi:hypothetical protein
MSVNNKPDPGFHGVSESPNYYTDVKVEYTSVTHCDQKINAAAKEVRDEAAEAKPTERTIAAKKGVFDRVGSAYQKFTGLFKRTTIKGGVTPEE